MDYSSETSRFKNLKKYLFLTSCMGYIFAVIMYHRKRPFMLLFQRFSDLSKKSRSILNVPTDKVSPHMSYMALPYHPALLFWDLLFRQEKVESGKSKEKATILHIESPPYYDRSRILHFPSNIKNIFSVIVNLFCHNVMFL